MRRTRPVLAVLAAAALLTTGCGDDPATGTVEGSTPLSSASDSATSEAFADPSADASVEATAGTDTADPSEGASDDAYPSPSASEQASGGPTQEATATDAPSEGTGASPGEQAAVLFGDGVDLAERVVAFGALVGDAEQAFAAAFGAPSADSGIGQAFSTYGTCPGSKLRVLEYFEGSLLFLFGDEETYADEGTSDLHLYGWRVIGDAAGVPPVRALVGDTATFSFGVGTSVPQLQEGLGGALELIEGDGPFPASFRVSDQSSGMLGFLTDTTPTGVVTIVEAGVTCGD